MPATSVRDRMRKVVCPDPVVDCPVSRTPVWNVVTVVRPAQTPVGAWELPGSSALTPGRKAGLPWSRGHGPSEESGFTPRETRANLRPCAYPGHNHRHGQHADR